MRPKFKMRPNLRQIDEAVDLAQEVVVRDMPLKAEAVQPRLLHHPPFAHHDMSPRFAVKSESAAPHRGKRLLQQNTPMSADRVHSQHIQRIYESCDRNVSETARQLNRHRRALERILAKRAPK
jgi:DNA-binding NtrC family response regulator